MLIFNLLQMENRLPVRIVLDVLDVSMDILLLIFSSTNSQDFTTVKMSPISNSVLATDIIAARTRRCELALSSNGRSQVRRPCLRSNLSNVQVYTNFFNYFDNIRRVRLPCASWISFYRLVVAPESK